MEKLDILGWPLEEALTAINDKFSDTEIAIEKTFAWNKKSEQTLNQARVLKVLEYKDKLTIITGYF